MKYFLLAVSMACAFAAASPVRAAEQTAAEKKDEYVKKARTELDALGAKIDGLEVRAKAAGASTRAEMERQLKDLKARRKAALKDFSKLKRASGRAWADIRAGLEKGIDDLKKELEEADKKQAP